MKQINPLNIDNILGNTKNRVAKIGVELEGGWKAIPTGTKIDKDTSVFKDPKTQTQILPLGANYAGEITVGPMQPAALPKVLKKYWPHFIDKTCGMHVHMSFENLLRYHVLMVPEFQETVIEYLGRWAKEVGLPSDHCIWERLEGKSVYCQKVFWADEQIAYKEKDHNQTRSGHRYTIVNYCGRINTIEVRVLPMMPTIPLAVSAINRVIDITNACLVALKVTDRRINGKLELPDGAVYEETIEDEIGLTTKQLNRMKKDGWL
jgi:hypothetical protein